MGHRVRGKMNEMETRRKSNKEGVVTRHRAKSKEHGVNKKEFEAEAKARKNNLTILRKR